MFLERYNQTILRILLSNFGSFEEKNWVSHFTQVLTSFHGKTLVWVFLYNFILLINFVYYSCNKFVVESEKVRDVNVTEIKTRGFLVSWQSPSKTNGHLLHYNVNISHASFFLNQSSSSQMFLIDSLKPGINISLCE